MDLSIIIPAFNEGKKIAHDIKAAEEFFLSEQLSGEIIIVDDGSRDQTVDALREVEVHPSVSKVIVSYSPNRGKGYAVRSGMVQSRGQYVMFADCGHCVPYADALKGIELIRQGNCDIAHGSRRTKGRHIERRQRWHRIILSNMFRFAVMLGMGLPRGLTDTQCGFKVYRGTVARELFAMSTTNGFLFDIEIILRAGKKGYKIEEFPVKWTSDHDSRVFPFQMARRLFPELIAIKRELLRK
jgi:dolichyl-phosphate beta-glucosyltransferase